MTLKEIIRHKLKNEDIYLDYQNRFVTKDLDNQNHAVTIDVCAKFETDRIKLLEILKEYKYSIYIESSSGIIPNVYVPTYVEKHDDITFDIIVKSINNYKSYYQLVILDKDGKKVERDSEFCKTKEYRDDYYNDEFKRVKQQTLQEIENIKSEFNFRMENIGNETKI